MVILAVVTVSTFAVYRVHGYFGSQKRESYADSNLETAKAFNPKRIIYEVFGPAGTVADISYFDVNSDLSELPEPVCRGRWISRRPSLQ